MKGRDLDLTVLGALFLMGPSDPTQVATFLNQDLSNPTQVVTRDDVEASLRRLAGFSKAARLAEGEKWTVIR